MTSEDNLFLSRIDGLFVGQLDDDEIEAFERMVRLGYVTRSYEGGAGLIGLAKVRRLV